MGDFIGTIFIVVGAWIISGYMTYNTENNRGLDKINTWAIENDHAEYDRRTGEIIYFLENFEEIIDK